MKLKRYFCSRKSRIIETSPRLNCYYVDSKSQKLTRRLRKASSLTVETFPRSSRRTYLQPYSHICQILHPSLVPETRTCIQPYGTVLLIATANQSQVQYQSDNSTLFWFAALSTAAKGETVYLHDARIIIVSLRQLGTRICQPGSRVPSSINQFVKKLYFLGTSSEEANDSIRASTEPLRAFMDAHSKI